MISTLQEQFNTPLEGFAVASLPPLDIPSAFHDVAEAYPLMPCSTAPMVVSPQRLGVVFSGGPAPGGHDVLVGMIRYLRPHDQLIGFLGGFGGLLKGHHRLIDPIDADMLIGTAGFDYLGTDRTKIATDDQMALLSGVIDQLSLDALFVVGGDDSNTNAMHIARTLLGRCHVIGIPKTIDGDMRLSPYLNITFGFHTATQVYAQSVNALLIDALATKKYVHFVKLMGRQASHVALEVALQTDPSGCVLREEVTQNGWDTTDVIGYFSDVIVQRMGMGKPYGVLLFPEGLAEVLPEFNTQLVTMTSDVDSHGNVNLSQWPLETRLMELVMKDVYKKTRQSIPAMVHFFGYAGRSSRPTEFDAIYSRGLGKTAYALALSGYTGVMAACYVTDTTVQPCGIPLAAMMHDDQNGGRIKKFLVDTLSKDYRNYIKKKTDWVTGDPVFPRPDYWAIPRSFDQLRGV
jgi:pyrophosphate--fructose-6-phosphate 1-phosphotransferase